MAKEDYFIEIGKKYPGLRSVWKKFLKGVIDFKRNIIKEEDLKKILVQVYQPFEQKMNNEREQEGFSRFVFKSLMRLGWQFGYTTSENIRIILKRGLSNTPVTQKQIIKLLNKKLQNLPSMNEPQFTLLKQETKFLGQAELSWEIYWNLMKILSTLVCYQREKNETLGIDSFLDTCTQDPASFSSAVKKETEIATCLDFIREVFLSSTGIKEEKILRAENMPFGEEEPLPETTKGSENLPTPDKPNHLRIQITGAAVGLILFFTLLSRFHILGDGLYDLTKQVLPFSISGMDTQDFLNFTYTATVTDHYGSREILNGTPCYSGDRIVFNCSLPPDCFMALICIDRNGIHNIDDFSPDKEPLRLNEPGTGIFEFELDNTTGLEVYYFFLSTKPFSFEKDIKKHMYKVFPEGNTKGPVPQAYKLNLKKPIRQYNLYFNHLDAI